tara:strand:+ start:453 stop:1616 length:1164 start_codon:yes stop_codon:yes gene_type:complete
MKKKLEDISMENLVIDFFWDNVWFFELIFVFLFFGSFIILGLIWMGEGRAIMKFFKDPPVIPYIGFKEVKLWTIGVLVPVLVVIFLIVLFSLSSIIDQIETNDWIETNATVDFAEEREETTCSADGNCTTDYWTHVEYIYEYENISYSGSRYTYISDMESGLSGDFPTGKEIDIFVDDKNPHDSLMIKGWDGVWIEVVKVLLIISVILTILITFLSLWKISFHLQSPDKKQEALLKPKKSGLWNAKFMADIRHLVGFLGINKKYQEDVNKKSQEDVSDVVSKTLKFLIDGVEVEKDIKNINDILNILMDAESTAIIYLQKSANMGRNIEMQFDSLWGEDIVEVKELIGTELVSEQKIDLGLGPLDMINFISEALSSSIEEDDDEWWV